MQTQGVVLSEHQAAVLGFQLGFQLGFLHPRRPAPDVPEPDLRQDVDGSRLATAVMYRRTHEHVVHVRLGIFNLDIEVTVVVENTGIDQLEFHRARAAAARILLDQPLVGIRRLRQLVEHARVRVAGHCIQIIIQLLDILAVITLFVC